MRGHKGQFPKGWDYAQVPDHYYYKGILVKRIDRGKGMIELVARLENDQRNSVLARGFKGCNDKNGNYRHLKYW